MLAAAGVTKLAASVGSRRPDKLLIYTYHRIYDIGPEERFPFDPELISATPAEFEWQMTELVRNYHPVHLGEALRLLEQGEALPRGATVITFDDGHLDTFTHAYPVLAKLGVPATIFLSTGYIGQSEKFWFDEASFLLYRTPCDRLDLRTVDLSLTLGDVAERRHAVATLLARLKSVPNKLRLSAMDELRQASQVDSLADDRSGVLTWDHVLEMRDGGMEFGSHTVNHPILSCLDEDELRFELLESKRELERRLGLEMPLLAYPVGSRHTFDEKTIRVAKECGYRLAVTAFPGGADWPPPDRFLLPRLRVERYTSRARFAAMLAFPSAFS